jgi:hypothetical protein
VNKYDWIKFENISEENQRSNVYSMEIMWIVNHNSFVKSNEFFLEELFQYLY